MHAALPHIMHRLPSPPPTPPYAVLQPHLAAQRAVGRAAVAGAAHQGEPGATACGEGLVGYVLGISTAFGAPAMLHHMHGGRSSAVRGLLVGMRGEGREASLGVQCSLHLHDGCVLRRKPSCCNSVSAYEELQQHRHDGPVLVVELKLPVCAAARCAALDGQSPGSSTAQRMHAPHSGAHMKKRRDTRPSSKLPSCSPFLSPLQHERRQY